MPDDSAAAGQAPQGQQGETPTTVATNTTNAANAAPEGQEPDEEAFDPQRALATIKKLRGFEKTAKDLEKRLKDYEQREKQAELAKLSEQERLQKELQDARVELEFERTQHRDAALDWEIERHAQRLGVIDPAAARQLMARDALEFDAEDRPKPASVETALQQLLHEKPYLAGQPAGPQVGVGNGVTRTTPRNQQTFTRSQLRDRDFYNAHRDAIKQAMAEGRIVEG